MNQLIENLITAGPVLGLLIGSFFGLLAIAGVLAVPVHKWMEKKGWLK